MISMNDIHWVAGFLEGEGSFVGYSPLSARIHSCHVSAEQKQKWPLEKLGFIIPGKLYLRCRGSKEKYPIWCWTTDVPTGAGLMMTIYPLMSPKRQEQIRNALFFWRIRTGSRSWKYKTHCCNGHEINDINTYKSKSGLRTCRTCAKERNLRGRNKAALEIQRRKMENVLPT